MVTTVFDGSSYLELSVRECGREVCISSKHVVNTPKDYILIHYAYAGKGTFVYGGVKYALKPGDCFYIPSGESAEYQSDPSSPYSYFWIGVGGTKAASLCSEVGFRKEEPIVRDKRHAYKGYFEAIYDSFFPEGKFDLHCLALAYDLFFEMGKDRLPLSVDKETLEKGHIRAAKAFIRNNYQFPISILDVAHSVGVSPNYLANLFAKEGEPSPKRFLIVTRMEVAAELLTTTSSSISEIAKMVGYTSPLHFSKSFSAYYGVSPLHYRNKGGR